MNASLRVRPAEPADLGFIVAANAALARETEQRELEPARLRAGVAAVLDDAAKGRYFVAEAAGRVVGQLLLTWEWSDWRNGTFWWIQSVYVVSGARGQGVFTALYRHVEALARADAGVCGLRLYVEGHNERARRSYLRLGFAAAGYEILEVDFTRPEAAVGR
jgi:GNAT superfamily N-acetyltransferase